MLTNNLLVLLNKMFANFHVPEQSLIFTEQTKGLIFNYLTMLEKTQDQE